MGLERFLTAGLIILAASASLSTAAQGSEGGADYLFFGEQHEALEWFARYESRSRAGLGLPARAVVPESDPRYAVTERKLSVIWDAFKSAYPEATAGLREPKLVILEDPVKNAYALYERATRTLPYLFVVQTGLIEGLSEDEMLGVMAHELAHLVFKHVLPGVSDRVQIYYRVDRSEEPLGYLQRNDEALKASVKEYLEKAEDVGPFLLPQLNGMPSPAFGPTTYGRLLDYLRGKTSGDPSRPICAIASEEYAGWFNSLVVRISNMDQKLHVSAEESTRLEQNTRRFTEDFRQCLEGERVDLVALLAQAFQVSEDFARAQLKPADIAAFDAHSNVLDALRDLVLEKRARMSELDQTSDLEHARIYTFEEQADEVSYQVMKSAGRDPMGVASFLLDNYASAAEQADCKATVEAGRVPDYGGLGDPHHSMCFRYFHLKRFGEAIGEAPSQAPGN